MIPLTIETRGLTCPDGSVELTERDVVQGPSGAGKTTLARAIFAALFGGLADLRRPGADVVAARLAFSHNETEYRIARTLRAGAKGCVFERRAGDVWVEETRDPSAVVGFDADTAEFGVLALSHGVDGLGRFAITAPAARKAALAAWVGADRFAEEAKAAHQAGKAADKARASAEGLRAALTREQAADVAQVEAPLPEIPAFDAAELEAAEAAHAAAVQKAGEHEAARRAHVAGIAAANDAAAQRPALEHELRKLEARAHEREKRAAELDRRLEALTARTTEARTAVDAAREAMRLAEFRASEAAGAAKRAREQLAHAEQSAATLDGVPCNGAEPFQACRFLVDALAALADLPAKREAVAAAEQRAAETAETLGRAIVARDAAPDVRALEHETAALRNERSALGTVAEDSTKAATLRAKIDARVVVPADPGPAVDVETPRRALSALRSKRDAHIAAKERRAAHEGVREGVRARVVARAAEILAATEEIERATKAGEAARAEELRCREAPGLAIESGLAKAERIANRVLTDFGAPFRLGFRLDGNVRNPKSEVHVDVLRGDPEPGARRTLCEGEAWLAGLAEVVGLGTAFARVEWVAIDGGLEAVKGELAERLPAALAAMPIGLWVCTESAAVAAALGNVIRVGA